MILERSQPKLSLASSFPGHSLWEWGYSLVPLTIQAVCLVTIVNPTCSSVLLVTVSPHSSFKFLVFCILYEICMKSVWDPYEIGMRSVWICMGSRWDMDGTSGLEQNASHLLFFMLVVYVLLALWWERGLWLQEHSNQAQEGTWPCRVSAWSNQVRRQPLNFDMIIYKHLGILLLQGAGSCVLWSSPTQAPETYWGSVVLQRRALSNGITSLWDWKVSMHSKTHTSTSCVNSTLCTFFVI